jgi:hypothetical protein
MDGFQVSTEELFELATEEDYYGWGRVDDGAVTVGKMLFGKTFRATAVITYSGPSAIFASLVMARTLPSDNALLATPVYLAMHMERKASAKIHEMPGFTVLKEKETQENKNHQCVVFMPNALKLDDPKRRYRIAIIDDVIMTGRPLRLLKNYLVEKLGYKQDQIRVGCCVCHNMTLVDRDERTPNCHGFSTKSERVQFPWGDGIFFPRPS